MQFVRFLQQRDPVIVIQRDSHSKDIEDVRDPWKLPSHYCLWNQALVPMMQRRFVAREPSPYHTAAELPVIEFWYSPLIEDWNGRSALTQCRIWASFENLCEGFESWYNAVIRWIRTRFVKDSVMLHGYIGTAAYEWFKAGGLLLPHLRPPVTKEWLSWVDAQDQHRSLFS